MPERAPLAVELAAGWLLTLAGVRRERSGDVMADVILSNGQPVHADRINLTTPAGRAAFVEAAAIAADGASEHRPAGSRIATALLALVPDALADLQDAPAKRTHADALVTLALDGGAALFHTPDGDAYADVTVAGRRDTWALRTRGFRRWLAHRFHDAQAKAPSAQALQDALGVLEGQALYDGAAVPVHVRIAGHDGALYLDLGDADWRAVEITAAGWRVVTAPPVRFRRSKGMLALPAPESGGSLEALRPFLNVSDDGWELVRAWLLQAVRERGPYPALVLTGEQGSAKSTTARALRALVDPSSAPLRRPPRDERDLMIAANNSWCIVLDNLSGIPPWLSDALCTLATGGGYATRELYADADEVLFNAQRPVMLTAIEDVVTRGDLMDRSLLVTLPAIRDERRRPEAEFWSDFEATRPRILGALLDHAALALRDVGALRLDRLPRMADFALWVRAGLGAEPGQAFSEAYGRNRASAHDLALEGSLLAGELRAFMQERERWQGTAAVLLAELAGRVNDEARKAKTWPKTPRGLSGQLRRIAPHLRAAGLDIDPPKPSGHERARIMTLAWVCKQPSRPSAPSAHDQEPHADADAEPSNADDAHPVADGAGDTAACESGNRPRTGQEESAPVRQDRLTADDADDADDRMHADSHDTCFVCRVVLYEPESVASGMCRHCRDAERSVA